MIKLYGFAHTRSIRVLWVLRELDVDFEFVTVNLMKGDHLRPEFLELNPAGKVPVLVDDELVLTESVAIVLYLAEKFSDKGPLPTDLKQKALVNRWLLFAATDLEQPLWHIIRHTRLYPAEERLPGEIPLAGRDFHLMAAVADGHLRSRQFLVGERVSVADFVMAYTLDWANELKLLADFPRLQSYMESMYQRPKAPSRIAAALANIRS